MNLHGTAHFDTPGAPSLQSQILAPIGSFKANLWQIFTEKHTIASLDTAPSSKAGAVMLGGEVPAETKEKSLMETTCAPQEGALLPTNHPSVHEVIQTESPASTTESQALEEKVLVEVEPQLQERSFETNKVQADATPPTPINSIDATITSLETAPATTAKVATPVKEDSAKVEQPRERSMEASLDASQADIGALLHQPPNIHPIQIQATVSAAKARNPLETESVVSQQEGRFETSEAEFAPQSLGNAEHDPIQAAVQPNTEDETESNKEKKENLPERERTPGSPVDLDITPSNLEEESLNLSSVEDLYRSRSHNTDTTEEGSSTSSSSNYHDLESGIQQSDKPTSSIHKASSLKPCVPDLYYQRSKARQTWWKRRSVHTVCAVLIMILGAAAIGAVTTVSFLQYRKNRASPSQPVGYDDESVDFGGGTVGHTPTNETTGTIDDVLDEDIVGGDMAFNNDGTAYCSGAKDADDSWNSIPIGATNLTSGPMVGHTTSDSTMIWAYADGASMIVLYQRVGDCPSLAKLAAMPANQTTLELTGLTPNSRYRFHILVDGEKVGRVGSFRTSPRIKKKFRYMFGSCISFKRDPEQTIWHDILDKDPEFLLLNGDTVYVNSVNYTAIWDYHIKQRQIAPFANIIRQKPVYATWDDHDYGPNDSDGETLGKETSLQAFSDVFANPSYGTDDHPGIHTTFRHGDVQFFIVDNRYHRMSSDTYAGEVQMRWLKFQLYDSTAIFKIIVHGGTIRRAGSESWFERSMKERRELLDFIAEFNITGVLFHGGDIHKNLFNTHPKCATPSNGIDYEVYELVSSGISNRGGCFAIVDIDTSDSSSPTLTYTMYQAGVAQEQGRLTILDNHTAVVGVMSHELFLRDANMALEYNDCQQNETGPTFAYPTIGGLEDS